MLFCFFFPLKNLVDLNGQSDRVYTGIKGFQFLFRTYRLRVNVHSEQYYVCFFPPDSARLNQPFGNPVMPVKKKRKSSGSEDPSIRKCKISR